jgi:hypothetical protein
VPAPQVQAGQAPAGIQENGASELRARFSYSFLIVRRIELLVDLFIYID